ncbi:hypothetical protein [Hymenobacter lapidarius]|uniref:hypothetical protein n=1 Tax=Hymenobacter lapidarius TaxID=1908237 RepID=UPI000F78B0AC|nr:hypothetical protein [Hymenobacter lapidarius]
MKTFALYTSFVSVLFLSACKDKEVTPIGPIEGRFDIVNEQGKVMTSFAKGQNVIFRFEVKNTTSEAVFLKNPLFDAQQFLELYQLSSSTSNVLLGKPYNHIFCDYRGGFNIPARSTITLNISWVEVANYSNSAIFCSHAANSYLQPGRYKSSFAAAFTILKPTGPETVLPAQSFSQEFDVR